MNVAMQLVVPMAGAGRRFSDAGYALPKPLIPVSGVPMVARQTENVTDQAAEHYVVRAGDSVARRANPVLAHKGQSAVGDVA